MKPLFEGDLYCGFTGLPPLDEPLALGDGVILAPAYAHLMLPRVIAFKPAPPNSHHPGPWKTVHGSTGVDIRAQLTIPEAFSSDDKKSLALLMASLLRLWVNPHTTLAVFANAPFEKLPEMNDADSIIAEHDIAHRSTRFGTTNTNVTAGSINWVIKNWKAAFELAKVNDSLPFALDCVDSIHYAHSPGAALLSIWSAIEALFSSDRTELTFRVSLNVATFLKPPGPDRLELQKRVVKLYKARSAVAHGSIKADWNAIVESYDLLRGALIKIIELGKVPSAEALVSELLAPASTLAPKTATST